MNMCAIRVKSISNKLLGWRPGDFVFEVETDFGETFDRAVDATKATFYSDHNQAYESLELRRIKFVGVEFGIVHFELIRYCKLCGSTKHTQEF